MSIHTTIFWTYLVVRGTQYPHSLVSVLEHSKDHAAQLLEPWSPPDEDGGVLTFITLQPQSTQPTKPIKVGLECVLLEWRIFLEFLAPLSSCSKWVSVAPRQGLGTERTVTGDRGPGHPMPS